MKQVGICLIIILSIPVMLFAQDIIYLRDGSIIAAKVLEIGSEELVYIPFENQDEGKQVIPLEIIKSVTYENGYSEIYDSVIISSDMLVTNAGEIYNGKILTISESDYTILLGEKDGKNEAVISIPTEEVSLVLFASTSDGLKPPENFASIDSSNDFFARLSGINGARVYYNPKNVFWSLTCVSFINPLAGIITGLVAASHPPKEKTINHLAPLMLDNPDYRKGFDNEVLKIKKKNIVKGVLTGTGLKVVLVSAAYLATIILFL